MAMRLYGYPQAHLHLPEDGREGVFWSRSRPPPVPARRSPPFAVITDDETGTKYPLADYELLPNMAIVDADNMMTQPRGPDLRFRHRRADPRSGGLCLDHGDRLHRRPGAQGDEERVRVTCLRAYDIWRERSVRPREDGRRLLHGRAWRSPTPSWASATRWRTSSAHITTCRTA